MICITLIDQMDYFFALLKLFKKKKKPTDYQLIKNADLGIGNGDSYLTLGLILMEVICSTISEGLCRSMSHLCIFIWNQFQVLEPSPQGVFLIVILRVLVGI